MMTTTIGDVDHHDVDHGDDQDDAHDYDDDNDHGDDDDGDDDGDDDDFCPKTPHTLHVTADFVSTGELRFNKRRRCSAQTPVL